jgi:ABC-type sugar transport system ATPase subunit
MIRLEGVSKSYGDFVAVDDVSFTALPGRVTGFLGPNGAGKSTSMRIMVGPTAARSRSADTGTPTSRTPAGTSASCWTPRRSMPAAPDGRCWRSLR